MPIYSKLKAIEARVKRMEGVSEKINQVQIEAEKQMEALKARAKEMEEEAEKINQLQMEMKKLMAVSTPRSATVPLSLKEKQVYAIKSLIIIRNKGDGKAHIPRVVRRPMKLVEQTGRS